MKRIGFITLLLLVLASCIKTSFESTWDLLSNNGSKKGKIWQVDSFTVIRKNSSDYTPLSSNTYNNCGEFTFKGKLGESGNYYASIARVSFSGHVPLWRTSSGDSTYFQFENSRISITGTSFEIEDANHTMFHIKKLTKKELILSTKLPLSYGPVYDYSPDGNWKEISLEFIIKCSKK